MKSINKIRVALIAAISFFTIFSASSQVTKTDYFMETSYLRNSLNPALRPDQGYLVVPALPNVGVGAQTNNFNLDNLTFPGVNGGKRVTFMHPSVGVDDFLSDMSDDNYINADVNTKLFGIGFFKGDAYWNIDLGLRTHVDANVPIGFFELLKKGFNQDGQTTYDLSDLSATGTAFVEIGVGYSRPLMNNNLMLGARVKLLGGIGDFDFKAKRLSIDAGLDYWRARSQVNLKGSAVTSVEPTYDEKGNLDGFDFGGFNMPGMGAGLDIGAVYDFKDVLPLLDGLKASVALNDIGFISWSKKGSLDLHSPNTDVIINPSDYTIDDTSLSDIFEDAFDDIKEAINLRGNHKARTSMLRMNMNAGVEYSILKSKLSVGALYSARFGNYFTTSEFTFSGNYRPCPWFATSLSYSFVHSKFDTFGFAMHLAPTKGLSLFLASDYSIPHVNSDFIPTTTKALNFQFGISIPLGGKKHNAQAVESTTEQ